MKKFMFIFIPCVIITLLVATYPNAKDKVNAASSDFEIKDGVLISYNGKSTNVIIPNSVTSIKDHAFQGNKKITSVTIPDSVISIGAVAFASCYELEKVTMDDSVKSLGGSAFEGCAKLEEIKLSNSLTTIEIFTFSDCKQLKSITIPSSIGKIEEAALQCCTKLRYVTVPDELKEFENGAFGGSNNLTFYGVNNSYVSSFASKEKLHYKTLALSKTKASISAGKTLKLNMNSYADCTWKSNNKKIATVSKTGKVTAKKKGKVIITAKIYGKKYQCKVTVK